jgi:hypothetical protein
MHTLWLGAKGAGPDVVKAMCVRLEGGPSDGEIIRWNGFRRWYVPVIEPWDGIIRPGAICYAGFRDAEYRLDERDPDNIHFVFAGFVNVEHP